MLDAITLTPRIKPVATNVNGLPAGFGYPLMLLKMLSVALTGNCSVMGGLFDLNMRITDPQEAFLPVATPFTLE